MSINNVKRIKKKKNMASDEEADSGSSEEELDLTKECHPIAHYIDDRAEMINQMFSVIKGNKLKAMLPPILKDIDLEQLKLQCLDQLLGMSEKRITCLLDGEILDSSSESDDASEVSQSQEDSESDKSSQMSDNSSTNRKRKSKKRKSDTESVGKGSKVARTEEDAPVPEQGKTLLEILELEMRARAIRALLNQGGDPANSEVVIEGAKDDQPTISGVVDLTEDDDEFPTIIKQEPASEQELTFEQKVEKSKAGQKAKAEVVVAVNKQKLIAETELRNKLIKKKTYRTRKQRLENVEEEEAGKDKENVAEIVVKEEPTEENTEIVIEDPEEGEVSTEEEEEGPTAVKEEKPDSPPAEEPKEKAMDGERIEAIDDGNFVVNENVQYHGENAEDRIETHSVEELDYSEEIADSPKTAGENSQQPLEEQEDSQQTLEELSKDGQDLQEPQEEHIKDGAEEGNNKEDSQGPKEDDLEQTSWRGRWLQNEQVQKVVKSSKICGKVKKSIAKKKVIPVKEVMVPEVVNSDSNSGLAAMEGSVDEYKLLKGKEVADVSTEDGPPVKENAATEDGLEVKESAATEDDAKGKESSATEVNEQVEESSKMEDDGEAVQSTKEKDVSETTNKAEEALNTGIE